MLKRLVPFLFLLLAVGVAQADEGAGINSSGDNILPLGAGGQTVMTITPENAGSANKLSVGIGQDTPKAKLDVNGGVRIGNVRHGATNCAVDGTLTYEANELWVCKGSVWKKVGNSFPLRENICEKADKTFGFVTFHFNVHYGCESKWRSANGTYNMNKSYTEDLSGSGRGCDVNNWIPRIYISGWSCVGGYGSPPAVPSCVNSDDGTYGLPSISFSAGIDCGCGSGVKTTGAFYANTTYNYPALEHEGGCCGCCYGVDTQISWTCE